MWPRPVALPQLWIKSTCGKWNKANVASIPPCIASISWFFFISRWLPTKVCLSVKHTHYHYVSSLHTIHNHCTVCDEHWGGGGLSLLVSFSFSLFLLQWPLYVKLLSYSAKSAFHVKSQVSDIILLFLWWEECSSSTGCFSLYFTRPFTQAASTLLV